MLISQTLLASHFTGSLFNSIYNSNPYPRRNCLAEVGSTIRFSYIQASFLHTGLRGHPCVLPPLAILWLSRACALNASPLTPPRRSRDALRLSCFLGLYCKAKSHNYLNVLINPRMSVVKTNLTSSSTRNFLSLILIRCVENPLSQKLCRGKWIVNWKDI